MASTYHADIQALYVAYFNRPADYLGLDFWEKAIENAVAAAGSDTAAQAAAKAAVLAQISAGFAASDEYLDVYGGLPTEEVIGQVYQNLFGHAPDLEGLVFWVNAVRGGHMTIANAVTTIAAGAQGTDLEAFQNKVAAATAFTNEFDTGEEVLAYNGDEALTAAKAFIGGITTDATLEAALADIENQVAIVVDAGTPEAPVIQHTLTAGIDTIPGNAGNDVITGVVDATANSTAQTFTALDTIDGGAGSDELVINMLTSGSVGTGVSVTNVELATVRSAGDATVTTTSWTGLESVSVVQAAAATVTAGSSTDVTVAGATGTISVQGGADVTVAASTVNQAVSVGTTTSAAGAVSITHTKQGSAAIAVDGGTSVTVTASGVTSGQVNIGQGGASSDLASGAINVTSTGAAVTAAGLTTLGAINIDGGTTVVVNRTATSSDAAILGDTTGATVNQGAVNIDAGANTTSVTVNQSAAVGQTGAVDAVDGNAETNVVTFTAAAGANVVYAVGGLSFTTSKALTAAQVAAAFANLSAGATHGSAPASNGVYSGTFSAEYTTGAVTGATVTATSVEEDDATDLTATGGASITTTTQGLLTEEAEDGVLGVVAGTVDIDGNLATADKLTTVSLNSYGASSIVRSDALTSLTLANSVEDITVANTVATSLTLGLNAVGSSLTDTDIALGTTYTSLTVNTTGASSNVDIDAAAVTALTISGDKSVTLTGSTLTALKTVTVTGAAGVTGTFTGVDTTSVTTANSTGNSTVTIDGTKATFTGGAGKDAVTLSTTNPTKAINLGAGDDSLSLAAGTTTSSTVLNGGDGSDTLVMDSADAEANSVSDVFETKFDGFEKLSLRQVAALATDTIDLSNMDDISYVISAGNAGVALVLDEMAGNGTLELTGAGVLATVNLADATGTADVLNVVVKGNGVVAGIVEAAGVETINVTATDTTTSAIETHSLTLKDAALKSVVVTGNSHLNLSLDTNVVALSSLNASAMTGNLTAGTNGTVAQTILGGSGRDTLTANGNADVLNGGAGNDTLIAKGDLNVLTGGAGADTFDVSDKTSNVNGYATITDLAAGDKIKFETTAAKFMASKVTLADTAVFQDYANAAIALSDAGDVVWFQFGGNTYVVQNFGNSADTTFTNNEDIIVKITGAVDLSTASFSSSADILLIGGPSA